METLRRLEKEIEPAVVSIRRVLADAMFQFIRRQIINRQVHSFLFLHFLNELRQVLNDVEIGLVAGQIRCFML